MAVKLTEQRFESSVNPEGIQTFNMALMGHLGFESSVNPEGIQTSLAVKLTEQRFESSVNPEGIQTKSFIDKD